MDPDFTNEHLTTEQRDALEQELLELHFGCHEDPDALKARLASDPALQRLQRHVQQKAELLDRAARPAQPRLALAPPARTKHRWPDAKKRLVAGFAAAVAVALVPFCLWQVEQARLARAERAMGRLVVSAPRAIATGAPWTFTAQSSDLLDRAAGCRLSWKALAGDGAVLARGERESPGSVSCAVPASLVAPARLEVRAELDGGTVLQTLELAGTAPQPLVHVATDKPVYRPGEPVYVRAVVLDRITLEPSASRAPLVLRILDPRGAQVGAAGDVAAGPGHGDVGAHVWRVPADAGGGRYEVEITAKGKADASERVPFVVRAYEAPRLAKTLVLDRKTYAPGASGSAEVKAERMAGGPAAGAAVRASLVIDGAERWTQDGVLDAAGRAVFRFAVPKDVALGAARFVARVTDGGVVETELKPFVVPTGKIELALCPEGGSLVAGVENRVYLEATDPLGRPVEAEGEIVDAAGAAVATFRTEHQGRARISLTPAAGTAYRARVAGQEQAFALPAVAARGVVLRALDDQAPAGAPLRLRLAGGGDGPFAVAAFCRGVQVGQTTVAAAPGGAVAQDVALELPASACGVLRVTVFDRALRPVAERLVQRAAARLARIELAPAKAALAPGERQTLSVRTRDEQGQPLRAVVGITVTDRAALSLGDEVEVGLLDDALLFADVERLPDLGDFATGGANAARDVDLLLGTRGWRRFTWLDDDAARAVVAARGEPAQRLLGREGLGQAPQVADSRAEASERLAALREAAWRARRSFGDIAQIVGQLLVLLVLAESIVAFTRRLGGTRAAAAIAATAICMMAVGLFGSLTVMRSLGSPAGAAALRWAEDEAERRWRFGADPAAEPGIVMYAAAVGAAKKEFRPGIPQADPVAPGFRVLPASKPTSTGTYPSPGGAFARQYLHSHTATGQRSDFTETICWQPLLLTDERGEASVGFDLSDSVTTWVARADAHGHGRIGQATKSFDARLPFHLEAKLPVELSGGDRLLIPVAVTAEDGSATALVRASTDGPLALRAGDAPTTVALTNGRGRALIAVSAAPDAGEATLRIAGSAGRFDDVVERRLPVAPRGFPHARSWGGTVAEGRPALLAVPLPADMILGSGRLTLTVFPSPLAGLAGGLQGLLQEPSGCFEQASSTNYPNTLVLSYLQASGDDVPALAARARELLPRGYARIAGYECQQRGYEWFGGDPGHEALSAYGLLEFQDMAAVHDVDRAMVARTREWLLSRRDGKGGYRRNERALDSFGRAPQPVTDAYVTHALLYSGTKPEDLRAELDALAARAAATADAYELAVLACALHGGNRPEAKTARERLAGLQQEDGSLRGSTTSITSSGGDDLAVETTAFAVLAWLPDAAFATRERKAVEWLHAKKTARGTFGATQATIMALRALTAHAQQHRVTKAPGTLRVLAGTRVLAERAFAAGQAEPITIELWRKLEPGDADLRIELTGGGGALPWACDVAYCSERPADDPEAKVAIETRLASPRVEEGRTVSLEVTVRNRTVEGQPMTLATIGLPAGLEIVTSVLDDRRKAGAYDLWELRGRELSLYWRGLAPAAERRFALDLVARIPGTSTGPASRAYLYYTPQQKRWAAPLAIEVEAR